MAPGRAGRRQRLQRAGQLGRIGGVKIARDREQRAEIAQDRIARRRPLASASRAALAPAWSFSAASPRLP